MPSTGFYLFLLQMREDISKQVSVSMPSTGFYLFLPDHAKATKQAAHGVNALNGLLLISSKTWQNLCVPLSCVNALNGLLLISSTIKKFDTFVSRNVSMPSTGFYLFLRTSKFVLLMLVMCQCPQRASTYFFLFEVDPVAAFRKRVNALNGLLLISSTCTKLMSWHSKTVSMPSTGFYLFLRYYWCIWLQ